MELLEQQPEDGLERRSWPDYSQRTCNLLLGALRGRQDALMLLAALGIVLATVDRKAATPARSVP